MKDVHAKTLPTEIYLPFVESLFKNRGTLWTGMAVHIMSCAVIFFKTGATFYLLLIAIFLSVFAYRIYWFRQFDHIDRGQLRRRDIETWESRYVYGAAATAFLLGLSSAYAVLVLRDMVAAFMCIAVTMASMVSIVGRNYGSARAVSWQTVGCCLPLIVACWLTGDLSLGLMSLFLIPFALTTQSMATGVREFLHDNVIASREMVRIADQLDIALTTMAHGLIMLDPTGKVQVINRRAYELLGLDDAEDLEGTSFSAALRRRASAFSEDVLDQIAHLSRRNAGKTLLHIGDVDLEFSLSRRGDDGVVMIFEDVTARVAADEKILRMVRFDALTGLPSRNWFVELAGERLADEKAQPLASLVILNVDGFKHVNDMQGHVIGDKLLAEIARRLGAAAEGRAVVGRLVGDEFVVFATGSVAADLEAQLRAIHEEIQGLYRIECLDIPVTLNGGAVLLDAAEFDMEAWRIKADLALNDAKLVGNGTLTMFRPEMDARYVAEQSLKSDLRQAVENGELAVVYQPMYRPDGSEMECCEALVRWSHPERGWIAPNIFIPLAENMGLISQITQFVLDRACADCATWENSVAVSVNLSIHDLRSGQIVVDVASVLARYNLPPSRLHLEVTESCFMDEPVAVSATLGRLQASGVTIAIDDFGTGFSSLSYLDSLPIDIVKIDRAFVRDIGNEPKRLKLLSGIVHLSRELDLRIVIEGVETYEQLELVNMNQFADLVQGFIFSPPLPADALLTLQQTSMGRSKLERLSPKQKGRDPRAFSAVG